jgi:hypothetical protein
MRDRYLRMAATFATSALFACGDAAVDTVTAPQLAAKPATPVASQYPYTWELENTSSAIGIQITAYPRFLNGNSLFVVNATVRFQWANDVSAGLKAWLLNKNGATTNSSETGMHYERFGLPVSSGDTTFAVSVAASSTCGLVGKSAYRGEAITYALNAQFVQIKVYSQGTGWTNTPDVRQPECPPPPPDECETDTEPVSRLTAVASGALAYYAEEEGCDAEAPTAPSGGEPVTICYTVWRELWVVDLDTGQKTLVDEWVLGTYCVTQSAES